MGKNPAFQFYFKDWKADLELQSCSLAARGLMIELMGIMANSEKYGFLSIKSSQMDLKTIRKVSQSDPKEFRKAWKELSQKVLKRDSKTGVYYSKRMVEDYKLREVRKECGKKGGSPLLNQDLNQKVNQDLNQDLNHGGYPRVPPPPSASPSPSPSSFLSSSSVSSELLSGEHRQDISIQKKEKKESIDWNLVDYIGELLGKLEGMNYVDHPDKASHVNIVKRFPSEKIMQALQATQDAVIGGKNREREKIRNPRAYFQTILENGDSDGLDEALSGSK